MDQTKALDQTYSQKDTLHCTVKSQFYIQLVNRPHFGIGILLFGSFGQLKRVIKKNKPKRVFGL